MSGNVYISYAHQDRDLAAAVCLHLESHAIPCWIAPRDVLPGEDHAGACAAALQRCSALVLLFSEHVCDCAHVHREVKLAREGRLLVVSFRIGARPKSIALDGYLGDSPWVPGSNPPETRHLDFLVDKIRNPFPDRERVPGLLPGAAAGTE